MLLASNKSLAEYNLSWEPKLNAGKQKLVELYHTASQLAQSRQEKESKLEEQGESITLETAIGLLQSATLQAEEESEKLAEKFLERDLDVDSFVEEFQHRRKMAHLRKVKSDKMKELVAKQKHPAQKMGLSNHSRPAPPPPSSMTQPSNNSFAPYPVTNVASNLPYPLFPQSNLPGMPYPMFPNSNMYPPRF